jgi:hypothetical protein
MRTQGGDTRTAELDECLSEEQLRLLTFIAGTVMVAAVCWIFWIVTYPLAKKLGVFNKDKEQ